MILIKTSLLATLLFMVLTAAIADNTTVLDPIKADGPPAALIIFPGALITSDKYLPLGKAIQEVSAYKLWICTVGGWMGNLPNPLQYTAKFKDAVQMLKQQGLPNDAPIYLSGHSLGGVMADLFTRTNARNVTGLILFSSYVTKMNNLDVYPTPILVISGDQDGLCRLTRIAKQFPASGKFNARNPVLLVQGVNHGHVASGSMPINVEMNDLDADLTFDQAHHELAIHVNDFMIVNGKGPNSTEIEKSTENLWSQHNDTYDTLSSFLSAIKMDHGGGTTWAVWLQAGVANLKVGSKVKINVESREVDFFDFLGAQLNFTKVDNMTINVTIPYHTDEPFNVLDNSEIHQSPNDMMTMALSKRGLEKLVPSTEFDNGTQGCNVTNFGTLRLASISVPYDYAIRYMNKGKKIKFLPDLVMSNKATWSARDIEWKDKGNEIEVTSPVYHDLANNVVMCKIVALSRALEYVLIDSFRKEHKH